MRVPLEILRQILEAAVEVLPFSELFRARLVNNEIWLLVLESDRLEEDGLGYRDKSQEFHYWATFPEHLKRQYLYRKIKRYPQDQSMFSCFMHEVLALGADSIRDKEEEALISKMIDAVYWERPRCDEIFSSKLASFWLYRSSIQNGVPALESLHPPEVDLKIALVCSAIKHKNCDELQKLLQNGVAFMTVSYRFGVAPLTFAAQNGNRETMATLLKYGRPGPLGYWNRKDFQRAMIAAAGCGNKDTYTELLVHKPRPGGFLGWKPKKNPAAAFMKAVRDGNVGMVGFILEEYIYDDVATLRCKGLIHAISFSQLDVMKLLLNTGGFDINKRPLPYSSGYWYAAQFECRPDIRLEVIKLLLENGADPNQTGYWKVRGLPLQQAVKDGNMEMTKLLLEYGADPNAVKIPENLWPNEHTILEPPLLLAMSRRSTEFIRLLLEYGANPRFEWKGRNMLIDATEKKIRRVKDLFVELGFEESQVDAESIEYILVDESETAKRYCNSYL